MAESLTEHYLDGLKVGLISTFRTDYEGKDGASTVELTESDFTNDVIAWAGNYDQTEHPGSYGRILAELVRRKKSGEVPFAK